MYLSSAQEAGAMGTKAQAGAALSLWWAVGAERGPQLQL